MDRPTIAIDPAATKLRRVGRLARHRMRIDGAALANGRHTDGTVTIDISGLGSPVAGPPDSFEWEADRPIALVIVRSGVDGEDVSFDVGPNRRGVGRVSGIADGAGIRYVAFCYDAPAVAGVAVPAAAPAPVIAAIVAKPAAPVRGVIAAARALAPTRRERRSILGMIVSRPAMGRATS